MAIEPAVEQLGPLEEAAAGAPRPARRKSEWLYFALRNRKFMIGFLVVGTIGLGVLFFGTCVLLMR